MINLNKQRIAVYFYFFIVLSIIFSLSFAVHGNKITGSVVFETAGNIFGNVGNFANNFIGKYIGKINLLQLNFIVFLFLLLASLALFIIRYFYETKNGLIYKINVDNIKSLSSILIILLAFGVLSFSIYFGVENEKVTGFVVDNVPNIFVVKSNDKVNLTAIEMRINDIDNKE